MSYQPYTYLIRFKNTGQLYYGVRWAKGCHPSEFWIKYFTTSKIVKNLIKEYGKDCFEVLYTKTHSSKVAALAWEEMYLVSVNAGYNENYLNRHNGGMNFCVTEESHKKTALKNTGRIATDEQNKAQSERIRGVNHPLWGKHHSEETRIKISEKNKGKIDSEERAIKRKEVQEGDKNSFFGKHHSEETRIKISEKKSKYYIVTLPDGIIENIKGLAKFCKQRSLTLTLMVHVAKGIQTHHKGFKCRYATDEEIQLWK